MVAIAVLDDYQNVALSMADWSNLQKNHRVVVFNSACPTSTPPPARSPNSTSYA